MKYVRALVFLVILLIGWNFSITPARAEEAQPDIVGGEPAELGQFPFVAQLSNGCGGSLITPLWVLTAGHCVPTNIANFTVEMGSVDVFSSTLTIQNRTIVEAVVHPDFNRDTLDNDFALLRVDQPFVLDEFVNVLQLTDVEHLGLESTGTPVTVVGWGSTHSGGGLSTKLRFVEVGIIDQAICAQAYSGLATITSNMLCAGIQEGGKDSCQGDSGGPLVSRDENGLWREVGVVSFGVGCGQVGYAGVYSRVSRGLDFVRENVGDINPEVPVTPTIGITWTAVAFPKDMIVKMGDSVTVTIAMTNSSELTHSIPMTIYPLGFGAETSVFTFTLVPGAVVNQQLFLTVTVAPPVLTVRSDGTSKVFVFKKELKPFSWSLNFEGYKGSETLRVWFDAPVSQTAEIWLTMNNADPITYTHPIAPSSHIFFMVRNNNGEVTNDSCTLDLQLPPPAEGDWTYILVCPVSTAIRFVDIRLLVGKNNPVSIRGVAAAQNQVITVQKLFDWGLFLAMIQAGGGIGK